MTADSDNPFKTASDAARRLVAVVPSVLAILAVAYVLARVFYFVQIEMR